MTEHVFRASAQRPFGRIARPGWVSAIGPDGFDVATGLLLSPTATGMDDRTAAGPSTRYGPADVSSTTGAILPGISAGITAVMVATPAATTGSNNFLFAETAASSGAYNWGFYETTGGLLRAFVHNGTTGVNAAPSYSWSTLRDPTVLVLTYGDGDNNVRVYSQGEFLASAAQTGTIQRNSGAHLSVQRWGGTGANFDLHAAGVLPFRLTEAEVARFFSTPDDAIDAMFVERRIWVPVSAGGNNVTVNLSGISASFAQTAPAVSSTAALVGENAAASAGTLLPAFSFSLLGQAGAASAGTLSPSTSRALSGQSAAFSAGSVIPSVAIAAIGLQATFTAGTLTASSSAGSTVALTGESAAFVQTTPSISVTVALTGIAATMAAGILSSSSGTATITVKAGSWLRYKKLQ